MLFKPLVSIATLLAPAFVNSVGAVNIAGWSSTVSCSGVGFACNGIAAWSCCASFPTGYGFSVSFTGLPSGSQGQYYRQSSSTCSSYIGVQFGAGDRCWNGGGQERAVSANWFWSGSGRRAVSLEVARRDAAADEDCVQPNHFTYTDDKGEVVGIKVPEGQAETIAELHRKKDFKGLARQQCRN